MPSVIIRCKHCGAVSDLDFSDSVQEAKELLATTDEPTYREFSFECPVCTKSFDGVAKITMTPNISIARYF